LIGCLHCLQPLDTTEVQLVHI